MGCKPLTNNFFYPLEIIHSKKKATEQKKRINYYPFGLEHKGYNNTISSNGNSAAQKFGFGGKELQDELGLDWYDVSARNYDPALGRWMNLDPLAEDMRRHSPYNYAFDNPIFFIDPDGMAPMVNDGIYIDEDGNKIGEDSKGESDGKVYVVKGSSKSQVNKATKAGKTIETSELKESFELPSNETKEEHASMVKKAGTDDSREFSSTEIEQRDGTTYNHNVEGEEQEAGDNAHINPVKNLPTDKKGIVKTIAHTHNVDPSKHNTEDVTYTPGNKPSPADYKIASRNPNAINVVINTRKNKVHVIKASRNRKGKVTNKRSVTLKSSTYFKKKYE
jgi:RHS repeat-associated protein